MGKQKPPAFQFYYRDFLHAVRYWDDTQAMNYLKLLCDQADSPDGRIPVDTFNLVAKDKYVRGKFMEDEAGFFNERMENILNDRKAYSERQSKISNKRWNKEKYVPQDTHGIPTGIPLEGEGEGEVRSKKVEKGKGNIPDYSKFKAYALSKKPNIDQDALKFKYESWVENGWRDGFDKPIKNWKSKLLNTLPHLKETSNKPDSNVPYKGYKESSFD